MKARKDRNLKLVDGRWYIDFRFKKKRYREFGGYSKGEARDTLVKTKAELLDVARGFKKPPAEDVDFGTFADEFLELYAKQNKRSWQRDELSLSSLKAFFKDETLRSIGPEKIERFKAARKVEVSKRSKKKKVPISPATVNRELAVLKTLFNKALEWGRVESNPAAKVKKFQEPPSRERILTADETRRLLKAAGPDLRPVLITALGTGMRRGEILALKWADVDLVRGFITITTSKSGKPRTVPMSGTVAEALGAVARRGEFVFHNAETGTHVKGVQTAFKAACRRAKKKPDDKKDPGITGLRFHDLRHTFASKALELGADIMSVSRILGHASITMTAKYLHPTGESMRLAVGKVAEFLDPTGQKADTAEIPQPTTDFKSYH